MTVRYGIDQSQVDSFICDYDECEDNKKKELIFKIFLAMVTAGQLLKILALKLRRLFNCKT